MDDDNDYWEGFLHAFIWFGDIPPGWKGFILFIAVVTIILLMIYL